jgi:SAM-dependent methyltransferase
MCWNVELEVRDVQKHVPPNYANFDSVAPFYGMLEQIAFGHALQLARVAFLDRVTSSQRALIVGEGNGSFLAELLRTHPGIEIDCVDSSSGMLRLARGRVHSAVIPSRANGEGPHDIISDTREVPRVARDDARMECILRFHHADILAWQPKHGDYDLVVTHFFLDCFDRGDLPPVINKISALALPHARWLISDFNLPPCGFARWHARIWLHAMYSFFHRTAHLQTRELAPFQPQLRERGFKLRARRDSRFGLISAQLWER